MPAATRRRPGTPSSDATRKWPAAAQGTRFATNAYISLQASEYQHTLALENCTQRQRHIMCVQDSMQVADRRLRVTGCCQRHAWTSWHQHAATGSGACSGVRSSCRSAV